jgi:ABC-2 type transport system ATP-binding protein
VDAAKKLAGTYSGGMRRRLDLAMTLVGDPRLIFLDEPTTGLDPRSRRTMWQIIRELVADGVTIFLTTQDLDEADQLADRIAVLDRGRIVVEGTPAELKNRIPGGHIRLQFADLPALESAAGWLGRRASLRGGREAEDFSRRASLRGGRQAEDFSRRASLRGGREAEDFSAISRDDETLTLQVPSDGNVRSLRAILDRLDSASIEVDKLSIHTPDLDDVFFAVTGHASTQEGSQR